MHVLKSFRRYQGVNEKLMNLLRMNLRAEYKTPFHPSRMRFFRNTISRQSTSFCSKKRGALVQEIILIACSFLLTRSKAYS